MPRRFRCAPAAADRLTQRRRRSDKYASAARCTCSRSIHSSLVWAWAMSPGPKTTQGSAGWRSSGPASVPKGTPMTRGSTSGRRVDRLLERLKPLRRSRGTRAGMLTQGWSNSTPPGSPRRSRERIAGSPRTTARGCSPGYQAAIDLDLAPVGNDVDALPPLDPADRKAGRAEDRVGHCCTKNAGVLGRASSTRPIR